MKKPKKQYPASKLALEAESLLSKLPRSSDSMTGQAHGGTQSSHQPPIRGVGASNGSGEIPGHSWDSEAESRDAMQDTVFRALLERDTARISEYISGRFEKCRDRMGKAIGRSKSAVIGIGLGVLVAVVVAVLGIVLLFVTPRLDSLDEETDELRGTVIRIEILLKSAALIEQEASELPTPSPSSDDPAEQTQQ